MEEFMENNNLENFIFFRLVKIAYILVLIFYFIMVVIADIRFIWGKDIDYLSSKVECYNGKEVKLCCNPFLYVDGDKELDKKSDYLAKKMCNYGAISTSEQNYELDLEYKSREITFYSVLFSLAMSFITLFIIIYIPLNILREVLLYIVYGKPIYWRWLWKWRLFS